MQELSYINLQQLNKILADKRTNQSVIGNFRTQQEAIT
uniref:Uncharacterized protein n=1 Tax=Arundo donax TaxID=35708 RepID=A0A0A8YAF8_ARUDO